MVYFIVLLRSTEKSICIIILALNQLMYILNLTMKFASESIILYFLSFFSNYRTNTNLPFLEDQTQGIRKKTFTKINLKIGY